VKIKYAIQAVIHKFKEIIILLCNFKKHKISKKRLEENSMKIQVKRFVNNGDVTLGRLYIDNYFQCYTLEDGPRAVKLYGETRIPAGKYNVVLREEGGFHERYSKRFPVFHVGMLWIQNVPGFEYILIHCGNTDKDTAGCLLVGESIDTWTLANSVSAYTRIYKQIAGALLAGESVEIEYRDNDLNENSN